MMNHKEALAELRAGTVRPTYLIYGGEPFLEEQLFRSIHAVAVMPETADFNYHVFHPASDQLQQAIGIAQTQPFFAERRLVVVRDCPLFGGSRKRDTEEEEEEKSTGGAELLLSYLARPVASTCLVFLCADAVDSRRKVTKAAIAAGGAVECKPMKEPDALIWAQHRAQTYGKSLGDSASRALLEKVGTDLRLIDSELNKLALYVGSAGVIRPADVEAVVSGMAETAIFHLTEAVMLKERVKAMTLLAQVLRQVDHPLQVLAALTNRFRQILMIKGLVARGTSLREGPGMAKMHPFAYEKMVGYVRPLAIADVRQAFSRLLEADVAIKSGHDSKLTVEVLVVDLMG